MYRTLKIEIKKSHFLYDYCDSLTKLTNNMENVTLFYIRQVMTYFTSTNLSDNQIEVMNTVKRYLKGTEYPLPTKENWLLSYKELDNIFYRSRNIDYFAKGLPKLSCKHAIKRVCNNMENFLRSIKDYNLHPYKYQEKPKLPHYHKAKGNTTCMINRIDCSISKRQDNYYAQFPNTDKSLSLGKKVNGKLCFCEVKPTNGIFNIIFTFEVQAMTKSLKPAQRICAIDIGVNNFVAMTNNINKPHMLFKGNVIKAHNQWYNKQMAKIQSQQTINTTHKFIPTEESRRITIKRQNQMNDFMHKVAKQVVTWCTTNDIDTLVVGKNNEWKKAIDIGKINNQKFVQIPFDYFIQIVTYLCKEHGVRLVLQEESYTSKASFIDQDKMPTKIYYTPTFSGKRIHRGLYETKEGIQINADINGSLNIGRKAYPKLFNKDVIKNYNDFIVVKHPDYLNRKENREKQRLRNLAKNNQAGL